MRILYIFISFLLIAANPPSNEPVKGYKDIEFGISLMELDTVLAKCNICEQATPLTNPTTNKVASVICSPGYPVEGAARLTIIIFDNDEKVRGICLALGTYSSQLFSKFDEALSKKYKKSHEISESETLNFESKVVKEISNKYAQESVRLSIFRDEQTFEKQIGLFYYDVSIIEKPTPSKTPSKKLEDDL